MKETEFESFALQYNTMGLVGNIGVRASSFGWVSGVSCVANNRSPVGAFSYSCRLEVIRGFSCADLLISLVSSRLV